jgi:replicative DNA helicase
MTTCSEALRVPPHSQEAEQAVLGGVMLSPSAFDVAAAVLSEGDFFARNHRAIWRAITELERRGHPFDAVTLGEWFQAQKLSDIVGGTSYVIELANTTPSAANVRAYAHIVRKKSMLRQIIDASTQAASDAFAPDANPAMLDDLISTLMRLQGHDDSIEFTLAQAEKLAFEEATEAHARGGAICGITTGLSDLDEQIGGWRGGDLNVIGARPGMGKTALMLCCAHAASVSGARVGIVSAEMSASQIGARMLAISGRVNARGFRTGKFHDEEWSRILTAVGTDSALPMMILDRARPTIYEVRRIATRWKKQRGLDILFLDYIQRIAARGEKRNERVGEVATGLKTLARELNVPVIALSQVVRDVDKRSNKVPTMSDLADSSEIEKEADQVALLYRSGYYDGECKVPTQAELHIDKNRHGPTGMTPLTWIAHSMRYVNRDDFAQGPMSNAA